MSETPYIFNVSKSLPDKRDFSFKQENEQVRDTVMLREFDSPVENQGYLGSCTAFAAAAAYENLIKQKYPDYFSQLSKLYLYYHSRFIEKSVNEDMGIFQLRNVLKSIKTYRVCADNFWPYNSMKFDVQPSPPAYADAPHRTVMSYAYLNNTNDIINAVNDNYPVVVGMNVFPNFLSIGSDGIVQMPGPTDYSLGGHAVCIVGYSMPENKFLAKNSFGVEWGYEGYCWIPFDYSDFYIFDAWIFDINNQQLSYEV